MQVSEWLGHGSYTLRLDVYGAWIPAKDGGAQHPAGTTRPGSGKPAHERGALFG